eukprot:TRINITY_DN7558_c0_g1_i2.p1 TRINITY_DN7558_c0_g1~~TRINITY_DN7558_c0_g1_i2.p1  ORF type:complete len:397 (-),score=87.64 TRINITY_DN7558_c0_g1_i2:11-1180(-)
MRTLEGIRVDHEKDKHIQVHYWPRMKHFTNTMMGNANGAVGGTLPPPHPHHHHHGGGGVVPKLENALGNGIQNDGGACLEVYLDDKSELQVRHFPALHMAGGSLSVRVGSEPMERILSRAVHIHVHARLHRLQQYFASDVPLKRKRGESFVGGVRLPPPPPPLADASASAGSGLARPPLPILHISLYGNRTLAVSVDMRTGSYRIAIIGSKVDVSSSVLDAMMERLNADPSSVLNIAYELKVLATLSFYEGLGPLHRLQSCPRLPLFTYKIPPPGTPLPPSSSSSSSSLLSGQGKPVPAYGDHTLLLRIPEISIGKYFIVVDMNPITSNSSSSFSSSTSSFSPSASPALSANHHPSSLPHPPTTIKSEDPLLQTSPSSLSSLSPPSPRR